VGERAERIYFKKTHPQPAKYKTHTFQKRLTKMESVQ
jgi:hypothetical protein